MAILRKLFGGKSNGGYERAIALAEEGRHAEALPLLRDVYAVDESSPRGSLAGYYLRQALVSEGKRFLTREEAGSAVALLEEAVEHWPDFPDLRFLAGVIAAAAGDWEAALAHARHALRRNPDYCEARLLEAAALQALDRPREAAASLASLVESGRRVDHALVRELTLADGGALDPGPHDLMTLLRRAAVGDDTKQRLQDAVSHCRAGGWDEGLAIFAELAAARPRYPDVRAKHAAALYQVGQMDAALVEVEAALSIKSRYRTAVSLRGLILAEQGRLAEARAYLADAVPQLEGTAGRHEELFLAYLRGVLAFLLGHHDEVRQLLGPWNDLGRQFARAALLLVACDHLDGWSDAAQRRLGELVAAWSADPELAFLNACLQLERGQWAAVQDTLAHWPSLGGQDDRPLLLQARLELAQERVPSVPTADLDQGFVATSAWQQLTAQAHLMRQETAAARSILLALLAADEADEETGRLLLLTTGEGDELPSPLLPDSWVKDLSHVMRERGEADHAEALVAVRRRLRPECLAWSWLSASFWLTPVRGWLA